MNGLLRMLILILLVVRDTVSPVAAAPDPQAAFEALWASYDLPVYQAQAQRSWTWGLTGRGYSAFVNEYLEDVPGKVRAVRYFDKGRMELNDPNANPQSPWYITSGLLPIELLTGRMQEGYASFLAREPARISAIGDPGQFPTYADLGAIYQSPGALDPAQIGKPVTTMLKPDGTRTTLTTYSGDHATWLARGDNQHGVAQAFRDFQTQHPCDTQGRCEAKRLYDPLFIFGLPVSEPYWVMSNIGGVEQAVLFQIFERRILTYTPGNPPGFQVEMGNIGRHYYQWRYGTSDFSPPAVDWSTTTAQVPSNPQAVYKLEIDAAESASPRQYRLLFSTDGGASWDLRSSGEVPLCRYAGLALFRPAYAGAAENRIGLAIQCADNPTQARGAGVTIQQSVDGGRTFWVERTY